MTDGASQSQGGHHKAESYRLNTPVSINELRAVNAQTLAHWSERFHAICEAPDSTPAQIIDAFTLHPTIKDALAIQAVREGYSLEEHTLMVLSLFEEHFGDGPKAWFRTLICLHDAGKGLARSNKDQHSSTLALIEELAPSLKFSPDELKLMTAIISSNSLGRYFVKSSGGEKTGNNPPRNLKLELAHKHVKGELTHEDMTKYASYTGLLEEEVIKENLSTATRNITELAKSHQISPLAALELETMLYQCDVLAYSTAASRDVSRSDLPVLTNFKDLPRGENDTYDYDALGKDGDLASTFYSLLEHEIRELTPLSLSTLGGYPSLEFLIDYEARPDSTEQGWSLVLTRANNENRLQFSDSYEELYLRLKAALAS